MVTFTVGINYCWQGRSLGKFKELLNLDVVGKRGQLQTIQWGQFENETVHQSNLKEVTACLSGGKTRRRRHRKQRKTRRH